MIKCICVCGFYYVGASFSNTKISLLLPHMFSIPTFSSSRFAIPHLSSHRVLPDPVTCSSLAISLLSACTCFAHQLECQLAGYIYVKTKEVREVYGIQHEKTHVYLVIYTSFEDLVQKEDCLVCTKPVLQFI